MGTGYRYSMNRASMSRLDKYIRKWKDSGDFEPFEITPESYFIRMDDMDLYQILKFREPLEAAVYIRYRALPEMLEESSDSLLFCIQNLRQKIMNKGFHAKSAGLELLDLLDDVMEKEIIDPEGLEKMKIVFNSMTFYAFHYTYHMRYWIRAAGHVEDFLKDEIFIEEFENARKRNLKQFIELDHLLRKKAFNSTSPHHLALASEFMEWAGDLFRQSSKNDG